MLRTIKNELLEVRTNFKDFRKRAEPMIAMGGMVNPIAVGAAAATAAPYVASGAKAAGKLAARAGGKIKDVARASWRVGADSVDDITFGMTGAGGGDKIKSKLKTIGSSAKKIVPRIVRREMPKHTKSGSVVTR